LLRYLESITKSADVAQNLQRFTQKWTFKHPYPYDFFQEMHPQFPDFAPYYEGTQTLELQVVRTEDPTRLRVFTLESLNPHKVFYEITYKNGQTAQFALQNWQAAANGFESFVEIPPNAHKIEIDPNYFVIELDKKDNILILD
jgi:hypothetical protein